MNKTRLLLLDPTPEVYEALQIAYDFFNASLFGGELPPCLITLQRKKGTKGYFSKNRFVRTSGEETHEIAMNPAFFAILTAEEVLSVLVHEMAHLWQIVKGKPGRARYHNHEWADKMEEIGLMPTATGAPGGPRTGDRMSHYIIPNGPFQIQCRALLGTSEIIVWLDRFPEFIPFADAQMPVSQSTASEMSEQEREALEEARREYQEKMARLSKLGIKKKEPARRDGVRSKYRCPMCGTQAWGKPALNLYCGECSEVPVPMAELM